MAAAIDGITDCVGFFVGVGGSDLRRCSSPWLEPFFPAVAAAARRPRAQASRFRSSSFKGAVFASLGACKLLPFLLAAMVHVPERKAISGPALIRLLARLTDARFPESEPPLADRLGQWLVWTDAIALSSALSGGPQAGRPGGVAPDQAEEALCLRVRTTLTNAVARDAMLMPHRHRSPARHRQNPAAADAAPDYAAFRQCYLSLQEKMESAIGNLRTVLRGMLATREPAMSRLAAVDAVMERVLAAREHNALAAVPGLLAAHFERLRGQAPASNGRAPEAQSAEDAEGMARDATHVAPGSAPSASDTPTVKDGPWLDAFRKDMQSVLFAELEIRFQPVEGLRAALRAS